MEAQRAHLLLDIGDLASARRTVEDMLPHWREAGNAAVWAWGLTVLAAALLEEGDLSRAGGVLEEARKLWESVGTRWSCAWVVFLQAKLAERRGDHVRAAEFCRESLHLRTELRDRLGIAECEELMKLLVTATADYTQITS